MKADIVISGGTVVDRGTALPLDVVVTDGRIAALVQPGTATAKRSIDARGKLVLPGVIDAHNHPVYHDRMDTFSKASLAGGITTVIAYVGSTKAWGTSGTFVEAMTRFKEDAEKTAFCDFSMHCTLTANVLHEAAEAIPALIRMGMTSFKLFTAYKKREMMLEDGEILGIMDILAREHCLLSIHAENEAMIAYQEEKAKAAGREHPRAYPATHPNLSEAEAIFRVLSLASVTGCPLYLPHVSARESLEVIALFRRWGKVVPLYVETCPHYLLLTREAMEEHGNLARMSPPLREQEDSQALWQGLADGQVDIVASDATGHPTSAKEPRFDKTFSVPYGTADGDLLLRLMLDACLREKRISLPRLVEVLCETPARVFGLLPRKGLLSAGADADMVIVDPEAESTLPDKSPYLNTDYSLYAGKRCQGVPVLVMQRGRVVVENGEVTAQPGDGLFLPRKPVAG